jgi:hypothetical protein
MIWRLRRGPKETTTPPITSERSGRTVQAHLVLALVMYAPVASVGNASPHRKPKPKDDSMLQSTTIDSRWSDPSPNHAANAGEPLTTAPGDFARGQRSQLDRVHVADDFATGMRTTSIPRVTGDFATGTRTTSIPRVTGDFATGMRTIPAALIIIDHLANAPDELPLAA